jgi:hypothetical protein
MKKVNHHSQSKPFNMKKIIITLFVIIATQVLYAQKENKCTISGKPWIVLNGQMVSEVSPNTDGSGISDYILAVKTTNPRAVEIIKTEEMAILQRTETLNGLSRWIVRFKPKHARTISTIILQCGDCKVQVLGLEQAVKLTN